MYELIIANENTLYTPVTLDGITLTSNRNGSPAVLKFSVVGDDIIFSEGYAVRFIVNGSNMFFGFIFTLSRDKDNIISITAYDQLRYFKNKDTYVYENKKASEVLSMIAKDFNCQIGEIEDTSFIIPSRIEENTTLFDIIQNALDITLESTSQMYILYDDFGKISLKNTSSLILDYLVDDETAENFSYTSSIDSDSYNKIKLTFDNTETGTREVYIAQDSNNINSWGILQYFDTLSKNENGANKANSLLQLYNKKSKGLTISNAFGDTRIRAGCMIVVMLDLGDIKVENLMLVESVTHTFNESEHSMKLTLIGGEFVG